ncbi:MAG: carbamoyl-phosphate synthase large subunit, partial [Defluviitaleaceae bacterium]|nr:carbamoyl-phosphate synthase large subunit [Defluviitaleaceae bacterium]
MPKRTDIKKILIIGSGPIIIGQACEFDYSGTQACQALRALGYEIVLVNSNPATIMTDPQIADATYIEPLNISKLTEIIEIEKPNALLPNFGGQTALNLSMELEKSGILAQHGVEVIGVNLAAIERGEDRIIFKQMMDELNIGMCRSEPAHNLEEALSAASRLGYPCVVRPAFTMGGVGGGICFTEAELIEVASRGIAASIINQVLIEESALGWEELELEIVRDSTGHTITVCYIENIDPMGVHTGDSICCAPMLDVKSDVMARLQDYAYKIVNSVGVIGGCNCQFAYNPKDDRIVVIEINPRTSRSSALASKATGFPIARVAAQLAVGITLKELPYYRSGTLDKYEPWGDYVVVKFPRWAFEKFPGAKDELGTQMKAVGEAMSIGKTYKEAMQKAIRSLENGRYGIGFANNYNSLTKEALFELMERPSSERFFIIYEAIRKGATLEEIYEKTRMKPFFTSAMKEMVELEEKMMAYRGTVLPDDLLLQAKKDGFADKYIAMLLEIPEFIIRNQRKKLGIIKSWETIQVSGTEDACYYYSTYNSPQAKPIEDNAQTAKVLILGGGPNRIGQGIEFDYCCVHAAYSLRDLGVSTVMINCNPETVSTDYDTADSLYFEPLTVEDVLAIIEHEKPMGVIVQFGGQTPLNIADELKSLGVPILGTQPDIINTAEDRDLFRDMMQKLDIPMPESGMAKTVAEAISAATKIGYPVMVRPSYVLGGRGMEVVYNKNQLQAYMEKTIAFGSDMLPVLIDRFLQNALECEADAISNGKEVFVPAILEHIEFTGVHSGDSACVIPTVNLTAQDRETIFQYTEKIARELGVIGLMNIQYAIEGEKVFVIEANPRASRTVPLVSKVCDIQMARLATEVMYKEAKNEPTADTLNLQVPDVPIFGVKESVFPFNMFHEVDPVLGPEMRSTGEVLGLADSFGASFALAQEGAKCPLPDSGTVLLSVAEVHLRHLPAIAATFQLLDFNIIATDKTYKHLQKLGIKCQLVHDVLKDGERVTELIMNGTISMVMNTPGTSLSDMGFDIRRAAIRKSIPMLTTNEA